MASQEYEYDIVAQFENEDSNKTIWDSTQHSSDLKGRYISVIVNLRCVARNTAQNKNGAYSIILEATSGLDSKDIEIGTKNVKALTINPDDTMGKILISRSLVNDGKCNLKLIMKKTYSTFSDKISGEIRGTIKCAVTGEVEEGEKESDGKQLTVGLDKNAVTDWFKTLSVDGIKAGQKVTDQYTVNMQFAKGKTEQVIWTNKGVNNNTINNISIDLSGNIYNNVTSQRVIDVDVVATDGEYTFTDNMTMEIVQGQRYANFDTSGKYYNSQLPNQGNVEFSIIAKNTTDLNGEFIGNVIIEGTTVSDIEEEDTIDDTDIGSIMKKLFGDGYSASGSTDSFMSAYDGLGDSDDKDLMNADQYKNMGMTDAMAEHIQELEARVTALENRLTELSVGGEEVDWYDGGYTGTDDDWGIGDWYTQDEERLSETNTAVDGGEAISTVLFNCRTDIRKAGQYIDYQKSVLLTAYGYLMSEKRGKIFESASCNVSYACSGQGSKGNELIDFFLETNAIVKLGAGNSNDWQTKAINFNSNHQPVEVTIQHDFGITGDPAVEDCRLQVCFDVIIPCDTEAQAEEVLQSLKQKVKEVQNEYVSSGKDFGLITGRFDYSLKDVEDVVEKSNGEDVFCNLFECENWIDNIDRLSQVRLMSRAWIIPEAQNKTYKSFSYDLLFSLNGKNQRSVAFRNFCVEHNAKAEISVGCAEGSQEKQVDFRSSDSFATTNFKGTLNFGKDVNVVEDLRVSVVFCVYFPYSSQQERDSILDYVNDMMNIFHQTYLTTGQMFAKLSGDVDYTLSDSKESIQEKKTKTTDEQEISVDMTAFDGTQTLFSYNAQSDNKVLQRVDLIFTFGYNYSDSQVCVGKKLKLDFNTVAVRPGFPDILTSYPIVEDTISASNKQLIVKQNFVPNQFANGGACTFKIDFSVLGLSAAELADLKEHFEGKIKGTIKYTAVTN